MPISGGQYRIDDLILDQAPVATWESQLIRDGLNGKPINSSYEMHRWRFAEMDSDTFEDIYALYLSQQQGTTQLSELETDPADLSSGSDEYGTVVYTDFIIKSVDPRTRGLPRYEDVNITFEVYVA
jgi:hypothetical protein